ncbi:MAG TPA: carbohydrate ABC transporter permease [Kineosporiaceae bacterium]|nr:carbohydrate ABC transporter permease [Kineosporiaceae bacterium]
MTRSRWRRVACLGRRRVAYLVGVAVAVLFAVIPILWMVATSVKTNREITQDGTLLPHSFTLANYVSLFSGRSFGSYLTNSVIVTVFSVGLALLLGTHAAYALARFRLWHGLDRYVGFALLVTRILPPIVVVIPVYLLAQRLSLLNTRLGLIVVYAAFNVSVVVWMMESFFREIPVDLEEAAMVDGDTRFAAFRRIVLPLAAPGLVATGIFAVIVTYNEFLFALVLTSTPTAETMPVGAATLIGRINVDWGAMSAAGVIGALPILLFSALVQKHLVRGLTMGAVK